MITDIIVGTILGVVTFVVILLFCELTGGDSV